MKKAKKLLFLSYMPTTLFFSYYHTSSIVMRYQVHLCKKKFESTNMDLTHSLIMIFVAFLFKEYGCSISHKIMPYTKTCKLRTVLVTHSLAYKNKELFKSVYDI